MELTRLLKLVFPLTIYYITEVAMGMTDMIIVGRLGSTELAAVGLSANIVIELILVCFGLLSMVGVLSSHSLGEGKPERVSLIVGQGFWVAITFSIIVLFLCFKIPRLFEWTGQDAEVIAFARDYLAWFIWITPFALLFVVLRNFLTVLSMAGVVVFVTLPAVGLNLLLNYLLVFGSHGFPQMGVAGAGAASVIVNMVMLSGLLVYVRMHPRCRQFSLLKSMGRLDFGICANIVRLGLPAGLVALVEGGLFTVVGLMMGTLGAAWLAANEILFHILPMAFVIALSIGEAAAVRIAFNVGSGNLAMTRWIAKTAIAMGCGVMLCASLILWFFPEYVIAVFIDIDDPANADVLEIALALIGIAAVFQLFDGLQVVTAWCLRGLKDTLVPLWMASAGYWVCGLGSGYLFGFVWGYGAEGVWYGLAAGLVVTSILLAIRLYLMLNRLTR